MITGRHKEHRAEGPMKFIAVVQGREADGWGQSGHRRHGEKRINALSASEWDLAGLCPGRDGRKEERIRG